MQLRVTVSLVPLATQGGTTSALEIGADDPLRRESWVLVIAVGPLLEKTMLRSCGGGGLFSEIAERKMPEMAEEVVLAAHHGDTERLRALLEAKPTLVDAVLLGRNETSR